MSLALRVIFVLSMEPIVMKVGWKYATIMYGELCAMTTGVEMRELLLVVNWDFNILQPLQVPIMGQEQDRSG